MNTYLLTGFLVLVCFGLYTLSSVISPTDFLQAEATTHIINYSNVNYTNIFINKTYMDIVKADRDYVLPARDLDYGIRISKTCYNIHRFISEDPKTNCPTYEAIMALFPDTSIKEISGGFIYKHNMLQREKAPMEKSYNYYAFKKGTFLFIDPSFETSKNLGMIVIESQLGEFPINYKVENNTRVIGVNRYIEDCRNAVIGSENWIELLGDTINFLRHDCHPTFTLFNDNKTITPNYIEHDITTSSKWLHDQFLEYVKENCLYEYDKC